MPAYAGFLRLCSINTTLMSYETYPSCRLYYVMRTDLVTYERTLLSGPPSDFAAASSRASTWQQLFGNERFDYRVASAS